jgi:hypothetical protein
LTLRLNGSTSGYTEIDAPAVAGSNTLVLPGGNGTADQALVTNGSGTLSFADRGRMVLETAQASTSGTSIDFTGIPSWVKRVTVMFDGVSTNGTSNFLVQLGDSGGIETTGYESVVNGYGQTTTSTAGLIFWNSLASRVASGHAHLTLLSGNSWIGSCAVAAWDANTANAGAMVGGARKTLSDTLTQVRITTVNGTDTFDAGSINILYEG